MFDFNKNVIKLSQAPTAELALIISAWLSHKEQRIWYFISDKTDQTVIIQCESDVLKFDHSLSQCNIGVYCFIYNKNLSD